MQSKAPRTRRTRVTYCESSTLHFDHARSHGASPQVDPGYRSLRGDGAAAEGDRCVGPPSPPLVRACNVFEAAARVCRTAASPVHHHRAGVVNVYELTNKAGGGPAAPTTTTLSAHGPPPPLAPVASHDRPSAPKCATFGASAAGAAHLATGDLGGALTIVCVWRAMRGRWPWRSHR